MAAVVYLLQELLPKSFGIRNRVRASTSRYSSNIGWDIYNRDGFVMASVSTVRCNPVGRVAAETTTLVSRTSLERQHYRFLLRTSSLDDAVNLS